MIAAPFVARRLGLCTRLSRRVPGRCVDLFQYDSVSNPCRGYGIGASWTKSVQHRRDLLVRFSQAKASISTDRS